MCKRVECVFHMPESAAHECNYIFVTGDSKIGNMPKGTEYKVETCPYYLRGRRVKAIKETPVTTPKTVREKLGILQAREKDVQKLYKSGLNDLDMSKTVGVSISTIVRWRNKRGFDPNRSRRIDWDRIEYALRMGYSCEEVSARYGVEAIAIEIYAERRKIACDGMGIKDLHKGDEVER